MENLQKEFTNYNQALALKELGFNEPCVYAWCNKGGWNKYQMVKEPIVQILRTDGNPFGQYFNGKNWNAEFSQNKNKIQCSAPTYSQAFRWFREKHNLRISLAYWNGYNGHIDKDMGAYKYEAYIIPPSGMSISVRFLNGSVYAKSYEEAESACLDKLIEIIKNEKDKIR